MKKIAFLLSILFIASINMNAQKQTWYKGNTHMHTTFSDGDSPIKEVVDWYHDHGYNFISITDHNITTMPAEHLNMDSFRKDFIMIVGNEITSSVHFTALGVKNDFSVKSIVRDFEAGNLKGYDLPEPDTTKLGHSQVLINGMLNEGALVFINHPNFSSGISAEEMLKLKGAIAIELSNAHPSVNNYGNDLHIPVEEKWDFLLSNGMKIFAVGSDDEHHMKRWEASAANPGRSWIMVEAEELNEEDIMKAIADGKFYASTGVELSKYQTGDNKIVLDIDKRKTLRNLRKNLGNGHITNEGIEGFKIEVIGDGGKVLFSVAGTRLEYEFEKIDKYIRIRASLCVKDENGYKTYNAWTQPTY